MLKFTTATGEKRLCFQRASDVYGKDWPMGIQSEQGNLMDQIDAQHEVLTSGSKTDARAAMLLDQLAQDESKQLATNIETAVTRKNELINPQRWLTLFNSNVEMQAAPGDNVFGDDIILGLWKNTNWDNRKSLLLTYLQEHFVESKSTEVAQVLEDVRTTASSNVFTDVALRDRWQALLTGREVQLGNINPAANNEVHQSAIESLQQEYVHNGKPTNRAAKEFANTFDEILSKGFIIEDFTNVDDFIAALQPCDLCGALKHTTLRDQYPVLLRAYQSRQNDKLQLQNQIQQQLTGQEQLRELASPGLIERLKQGFNGMHPGLQVAAYGLLIFSAVRALTKKEGDKSRWFSTLVFRSTVVATLGAIALGVTKNTKYGKKVNDFIDNLGSGSSELPSAVKNPQNLDAVYEYMQSQGEQVDLSALSTSLTLAQLPLKDVAANYTLGKGAKSGTLSVNGPLSEKILNVAGSPPQNQLVLNQVIQHQEVWGGAMAHMMYLVGLHLGGDQNRRLHSEFVQPQLKDASGNYDTITDPTARSHYETIAQDGLRIARQSSMSMAELMQAVINAAENDSPAMTEDTITAPINGGDTSVLQHNPSDPDIYTSLDSPDPGTGATGTSLPPVARRSVHSTPLGSHSRRGRSHHSPHGIFITPSPSSPGALRQIENKKGEWLAIVDRQLRDVGGSTIMLDGEVLNPQILLSNYNDNPKILLPLRPGFDVAMLNQSIQDWLRQRGTHIRDIRIHADSRGIVIEKLSRYRVGNKQVPSQDDWRKILMIIRMAVPYARREGQSVYIDRTGTDPAWLHQNQPRYLTNPTGRSDVDMFNQSQRRSAGSPTRGSSPDYNNWGAYPIDTSARARRVQEVLNSFELNGGNSRLQAIAREVAEMKADDFSHPHLKQVENAIRSIGRRSVLGITPTSSDVSQIEQNYMRWLRNAYRVHQTRQRQLREVFYEAKENLGRRPQRLSIYPQKQDGRPMNAFQSTDVIRVTNVDTGKTVEFHPFLLEGVGIGEGYDEVNYIWRTMRQMGIGVDEHETPMQENTDNRRIGQVDLYFAVPGTYKVENFYQGGAEQGYHNSTVKQTEYVRVNPPVPANNAPSAPAGTTGVAPSAPASAPSAPATTPPSAPASAPSAPATTPPSAPASAPSAPATTPASAPSAPATTPPSAPASAPSAPATTPPSAPASAPSAPASSPSTPASENPEASATDTPSAPSSN